MTAVKMINTFKLLYWIIVKSYSVHDLEWDTRFCTELFKNKWFCPKV